MRALLLAKRLSTSPWRSIHAQRAGSKCLQAVSKASHFATTAFGKSRPRIYEYTLGHGGKDAIIGNRGDVLRREGQGFDQHLIERVSAAVAPGRQFNDFFEAQYFGGFPPSSLVTLQRRFL